MSTGDFWTRRRAAVEAESRAEEAAAEAVRAEAQERDLEALEDDEILAELDLAAPEEMTTAEELRAFLSAAVPQRLRNRALRRLWRLNPVVANLDGLIDYGEDFTDGATVIENLQTVYQVGKGMFDKAVEAAESEMQREAAKEDGDALLAEDEAEAEVLGVETPVPLETEKEATPVAEACADARPAPRRMRFHFEAAS